MNLFDRLIRRGAAIGIAEDLEGFDPDFYRARYPDLRHLKPQKLPAHYVLHGRKEGRFRNLSEAIANLEDLHGPLPSGFDPLEYLDVHPDLKKSGMPAWEAAEHYLRFGRAEGRLPFRFNAQIYRELYFQNQIISDADLLADYRTRGRVNGKCASGADLMKARRLEGGGRWIEAIKPDEFTLLNFSWAGPISTLPEALNAMLTQGLERLAPISFELSFDPVFYRETHPELRAASDKECYRWWLFVGLEKGDPGSQEQFFKELGLALDSFPTSFDWQRYLVETRINGTRWSALRHFIEGGFEKGVRPVEGEDAGRLFAVIGLRNRNANDELAIEAFELARERGALRAHFVQDLADCHYRLEHWSDALDAYRMRMCDAGADVWTFCNSARAALKLEKIDLAFAILKEGKDRVVGSPNWRKTVQEAIDAEFDAASAKARACLKQGLREPADEIVRVAVARVVERFGEFDPLGLPLPVGPHGKIVMLANVDLRQCTHYRVEQKERLFTHLERKFQIFAASEADDFVAALTGASAAIFYRLPAFPKNVRAIEIARGLGIPTYYDIDDLIFDSQEYPEPFETYGGEIDRDFHEMLQFGVPLFRAAMSLCDYGISSTPSLAAHMKPIVRKSEIFVLPNGLDERNACFLDAPPARVRRDDSIVIFYGSGTKAHNSDFLDLAGPALLEIMLCNPKVKLMIAGYLSLDASFDPVRERIVRIGWLSDVNSYWSLLAEADINIAVLARYATTDAKSEIKWLEAGAMGIPSIVSGTAHYREVLEDGVDALISDTPEQWGKALDRLIADPDLRRRIGANAREKARRVYSVEANAKRLSAILPKPGDAARKLMSASRRILLVNIFFPPQTLGGSTRVVRDNLDCFLDGEAARRSEFAVVTTDLGGEGRNTLRVEDYRGCPVFRISTPYIDNMEWHPNHPHVGRIFTNILELWRPDLVHFHCVQRLSGAIVEACRAANIPYINTAHDAWWVADFQFLTDMQGRLREPGEALPFDPPPPVDIGQALDRRRYLAPLLADSAAILAVSKAFADIYRSCGFEKTVALPNGTPPLKPSPRIPSASGRVRLAHVGSITKFKGFHLVQAVLKQSRFANLEITVVDHNRYGGEEIHAKWGETPVRFVGKTVQEEMHRFYASQDVLLAPSLWPEPFGLVTREAIAAGLWVLASNRGAIGEEVTPGVNGWIVDVETPAPTRDIFAKIDANPEAYLKSPPPVHLRTAQNQADELLELYDAVLADPLHKKYVDRDLRVRRSLMRVPANRFNLRLHDVDVAGEAF